MEAFWGLLHKSFLQHIFRNVGGGAGANMKTRKWVALLTPPPLAPPFRLGVLPVSVPSVNARAELALTTCGIPRTCAGCWCSVEHFL